MAATATAQRRKGGAAGHAAEQGRAWSAGCRLARRSCAWLAWPAPAGMPLPAPHTQPFTLFARALRPPGAPPPLAEELRALRQKVYKLKDQDKHGHSGRCGAGPKRGCAHVGRGRRAAAGLATGGARPPPSGAHRTSRSPDQAPPGSPSLHATAILASSHTRPLLRLQKIPCGGA